MTEKALISKTDSRGRVRAPPQRREALLAEFERRVLSALYLMAHKPESVLSEEVQLALRQ